MAIHQTLPAVEGEWSGYARLVKRLEENQAPPSKRRAAEPRAASWADREVGGLENYPDDLSWPISDDEIDFVCMYTFWPS